MVKHLLIYFLLLPSFLFSGEFTASVNRNPVHAGESFTLNLTLKEASADTPPDIAALKNLFTINAQQQSTSATFMNGHLASSTTWKISLTPHNEGEAIIPSVSINTNRGILSSDPIPVRIIKGPSADTHSTDSKELSLLTEISHAKPYKNEPVFYTLKLISKFDLTNVGIQKFNIEDAVVESNGQPKVYKKMMDGIKMNVIEISFLIAPLKAGPLKIPSLVIQGSMPIQKNSQRGRLPDDDFDSFFIMPGFARLKPFTIASKETSLDVQPPLPGFIPWLPARSLTLEEFWDNSQTLQVGEPISRSFKIVAEGILSNQLPNLNEQQILDSSFKIYADKPETGDEIKEGAVISYRKEQYTLIPQQPGPLTLPEISLTWWDTVNNKRVVASIPARSVQIMPGPEITTDRTDPMENNPFKSSAIQENTLQRDPLIYALIAGLAVLLFGALFWAITLQKKIVKLTEVPIPVKSKIENTPKNVQLPQAASMPAKAPSPPAKDKKEKLPDLNPT